MKTFKANGGLSSFFALLALCAWFGASNHCALGLMPKADAKGGCHGSHCHQDSGKTDDQKNDGSPECCKSIQPTAFTPAKNPVSYDQQAFLLHAYLVVVFTWRDALEFQRTPLEIDSGPPRSLSFAESILQHSIFSHAPPALS